MPLHNHLLKYNYNGYGCVCVDFVLHKTHVHTRLSRTHISESIKKQIHTNNNNNVIPKLNKSICFENKFFFY